MIDDNTFAASLREMDGWQPIETAPKAPPPGSSDTALPLLLAFHYPDGKFWGCMVMAWNPHNNDWDDGMGNSTGDWDAEGERPTHWMPLPAPPQTNEA